METETNTPQAGDTVKYRGRIYTLTGRSPHGGWFLERNGHATHAHPDSKVVKA